MKVAPRVSERSRITELREAEVPQISAINKHVTALPILTNNTQHSTRALDHAGIGRPLTRNYFPSFPLARLSIAHFLHNNTPHTTNTTWHHRHNNPPN
jgi:hypothetical protein